MSVVWVLSGHLRRAAAAYAVLLVAVVLTLLATRYVYQSVEAQARVRFDDTVATTRDAIDSRANSYLDLMFGARGLFTASQAVEREEWTNYLNGIDLESRYPGIQALGYAPYVPPPEEREAFVGAAREEGFSGFGSLPETGSFPLTYVEPSTEANDVLLGDDMYSDPAYRAAMDKARDTGFPQGTGKVYLLSETSPDSLADFALEEAFVVFLPVYDEEGGRGALEGFIVGAFRMDLLLREDFGEPLDAPIDFEVYDERDLTQKSLLYDADGVLRANEAANQEGGLLAGVLGLLPVVVPGEDAGYSRSSRLYMAGQEWNVYIEALPEFRSKNSLLPLFVLLSGLGVSVLLFGTTYILVRSRVRAEEASQKLEDANSELEATNRELESFSYSVSHDLRAPLRSIDGFSQILLEDYADWLDDEGRDLLGRVRTASQRMGHLIDDLLGLSRVTRGSLRRERVDLSALAREVAAFLRDSRPERKVEFVIEEGLEVSGDPRLIRGALENLLGNAFKFTANEPEAKIEFGVDLELTWRGRVPVYYVRDNGAGFDMAYAGKLFGAFQRLHAASEFDGTGIGLATVQRIVRRHGGGIWAEGEAGKGATFFFTLRPGLQFDPEALHEKVKAR